MEETREHVYLEVNDNFRMRELDRGDLEQFNALLQYAFQVTSYDLFQNRTFGVFDFVLFPSGLE